MKILDRGGSGRVPKVFDSLETMVKRLPWQGKVVVREAAALENVFAKFMHSVSSAPVFALDVYAVAGVNKMEQETVAQAFEIHKVIMQRGKPAPEAMRSRHHTVRAGDGLSKIALTYYGNMYKWPVIFEANRDVIGRNPDLIRPGQRLLVPELPVVTGIKG